MANLSVSKLFSIFPIHRVSSSDSSVSELCFDSRKLSANCVFVAIRGGKSDGHAFVAEAAAKGAAGLVVEDASSVPADFKGSVAVVQDSREALNRLAAKFYGEPAKELFCVGVTGTNGKTTTTYMTEAIFEAGGKPAGVIGTINHHFRSQVWKTEMTTPDPVSFQQRLRQFRDLGAGAVALEVSSHALRQARVDEVPFDVAIFTNLTRDHLDYHTDMEDYFDAKSRLFTDLLSRSSKPNPIAVVNGEDAYGRRIKVSGRAKLWTYGAHAEADLRFEVSERGFDGTRFRLHTPMGAENFHVKMVGLHMVANACGAIGAGLAAGFSLKTCSDALAQLNGVSGRLEAVPNKKGVHVFVDYAHTDDALATVLHYLNEIRKSQGIQNKLITVFGCGGDRDKGKRPLMMKAALAGSDLVVLTSDNPRTEDPEKILDDAMVAAPQGSLGSRVFRDADRKQGIAKAIELASPGDVIVIAGKGHEDYQEIGKTRIPFSDFQVVKDIIG